jgi:hypothetical protein
MQFLDDFQRDEGGGTRDIVQFVEFNRHKNNRQSLTRETLDEIPDQLVGYFYGKKIMPFKPVTGSKLNIYEEDYNEEEDIDLNIAVNPDGEISLEDDLQATFDGQSYGNATTFLPPPMPPPSVYSSAPPAYGQQPQAYGQSQVNLSAPPPYHPAGAPGQFQPQQAAPNVYQSQPSAPNSYVAQPGFPPQQQFQPQQAAPNGYQSQPSAPNSYVSQPGFQPQQQFQPQQAAPNGYQSQPSAPNSYVSQPGLATASVVAPPPVMYIQAPANAYPGMQIQIQNPNTGQFQVVTIPQGVPPGGTFGVGL